MKSVLTSLLFVAFLSNTKGQENNPQFLKEPVAWKFEKFPLPPAFAPSILYKGTEELRFAPGMFQKDSLDYFTYVFVAELNNVTAISETEIRNYLLKYYRGLCQATAKDRKIVVDTSQVTVVIEKKKGGAEKAYNATVNLFGVFADGGPVKLNMEINVIINDSARKTYLFFLASPRDKGEAIWNELFAIRKKLITSIPF